MSKKILAQLDRDIARAKKSQAAKINSSLQPREADGQYSSGGMDALCVCGHRLGIHAAHGPKPCFNEDPYVPGATGEACECERFRKKRAKK